MKLRNKIVCIITLTAGLSIAGTADDCGAPPLDKPTLPSATTVTADSLKSARESTVVFSDQVDTYMSCMDQQGRKLLPYLTKEQQTRWEEDLTEIHENRRQLQIALNDLIRSFRKQTATK
jgi:hypothetical protein